MTNDDVEGVTVTTADGRQLDVLVSGPTEATPVVIHMGTPNGLVPLPSQLDPGPNGVRTVLYGRPGYCGSTPQRGRSVADAAEDRAAILDALEVDTFVTLGWSGGGPHALACAALLPEHCVATAVIASPAPYPADVRDWTEGSAGLALQGEDALTASLNERRVESTTLQATDMREAFACPPDRASLTGEYAEWLAWYTRSGWAAGIAGVRDDWLAFMHDWGFDLADARYVTVWHGGQDVNVTPSHGVWLAEHIPAAELRLLPEEGHISIGLRFPEIVDDLLARAGGTEPSIDGGGE